jgi:peptidoglycan/LPS O-acetylase OafA/YrhL
MARRTEAFTLIDGMRGLAAIAVASLHWQAISAPWFFAASGGLAVDLFFLLSGIVIAHAYDDRIANGELNTSRFMLTRLIRFWPLYALGTLLGGVAVFVAMATGRAGYYHSYGELLSAITLTLMFIPQGWGGKLFELNPPFWSLLWELVANFIFVLFWRRLSVSVMAAIIAIGVIGVIAITLIYGQLSAGSLWETAGAGPIRVLFSFFLGVLIYRTVPRARARSQLIGLACAALLIGLFAARPGSWTAIYHLLCVLLIFPAAGVLAMRVDVGGLTARVFKQLGDASYGVYVLHMPALIFVSWIVSHAGRAGVSLGPFLFLICCLLLVGGVLFLDRTFDRPVRKRMMDRFGLKTRRSLPDPEPI